MALLTISVIISNAIQSAGVLEGKHIRASLRRPDAGDRSGPTDGMVQSQKQGNQPDTKLPAEQGANEQQKAGKEPAPEMYSGRMLNSEIYQPETTNGRRLVTYKRFGGRLVSIFSFERNPKILLS